MADLIDRQAAIDAVYKCDDIFAGDMPVMVVKADAYEALAQLPSAQPELIRCKDCLCWDTSWKPTRAIEGAYWCSEHDIYMSADDYCSMAERKEE